MTSRSPTRYLSFGIWSPVTLSNASWAVHVCSKLLTLQALGHRGLAACVLSGLFGLRQALTATNRLNVLGCGVTSPASTDCTVRRETPNRSVNSDCVKGNSRRKVRHSRWRRTLPSNFSLVVLNFGIQPPLRTSCTFSSFASIFFALYLKICALF